MVDRAQHWLEKIRAIHRPGLVRIMNVCGGHERSIAQAGLRSLLPATIRLIPGPGYADFPRRHPLVTGILAMGESVLRQAPLFRGWGDHTLFEFTPE